MKLINFFRSLFRKKPIEPAKLKMYVLVRKELEETYRNVQGAHAAIEYTRLYHNTELFTKWHEEPFLIHLGVRFPSELYEWEEKLKLLKIPYYFWKEPDLDLVSPQVTAIACIDTGGIFQHLRLA